MRRLFVVAATIALAGCISYGKTQDREPLVVYDSVKSPDVYLGCIAPKFKDMNVSSSMVRDGDAWVVMLPGATATATVFPHGEGSRVEYRQIHELEWGLYGRARKAVNECL